MKPGVSVVILTHNEEENLPQALDSVCDWADRVFVFDSLSTDRTVQIAQERGCHLRQHAFEDFGRQRNAALHDLPIDTEWVLFLDADEWVPPELREEISRVTAGKPAENGFFIKRRFFWMGRWIKRGYYPTWILRLFRVGNARCEERSVNEHMIVQGQTGKLSNDLMHEDRKAVAHWIAKHNQYARREADELFRQTDPGPMVASLFGTQPQRVRWLRHRVWNRLPPVARPFAYFSYRYLVRGGVLDGPEAFVFHFLHALWFPMLIDVNYLEQKRARKDACASSESPR